MVSVTLLLLPRSYSWGLLSSQHGFIPKKGCMTAWKEVLQKVINYKFIYECDLENLFNAIQLKYMNEVLEELGIPSDIRNWIMVMKAPKLPKDQKLDESYYQRIAQIYAEYKEAVKSGNTNHPSIEKFRDLNNYVGVAQGSPISPQLSILCLKKDNRNQYPMQMIH